MQQCPFAENRSCLWWKYTASKELSKYTLTPLEHPAVLHPQNTQETCARGQAKRETVPLQNAEIFFPERWTFLFSSFYLRREINASRGKVKYLVTPINIKRVMEDKITITWFWGEILLSQKDRIFKNGIPILLKTSRDKK